MDEQKCHICGGLTEPEFLCTQCDELVCEDCMVKMTIHNQIDYCLCESCHGGNNSRKAEHYHKIEKQEEEAAKIKKEKAHKRWLKYHSPAQIEKRRLKRIELLKWRREQAAKRAKELGKILSDLFKYM
ncbi:MAG: hypothetical protein JWQ66_2912 [Mucilaginibacter sp.]|nr:hypothetical protein [Mucilaginibacter sp.]